MDFFIKRPGNGRVSFAIVKRDRTRSGGGTKVKSKDLDAINANYRAGALSLVDADFQAKGIVAALYEQHRDKTQYVANEANRGLLKKYWDAEYKRRRHVDKDSAYWRLERAVDALGQVSLIATIEKVQDTIDAKFSGQPRKQRAVAGALNQMRQHFKAEGRLIYDLPSAPEFKYLRADEVRSALEHVDVPHLRPLYSTLFHTGVRTGEAFALLPQHYRHPVVNVATQVDRRGVRRETKRRNVRKSICLKAGRRDFEEWLQFRDRSSIPRNSLARIWRAACKRAFPNDPTKWLCAHDLRHSFAVHMLVEEGMSLDIVAKLLGIRKDVAERYYLNFVFEDDTLESLFAKLR